MLVPQTLLVTIYLVMAAAPAAPASMAVAGARSPAQTMPTRRHSAMDPALVAALERSEAGDIEGLRIARSLTVNRGVRAVIDATLAASKLDLRAVRAALRRVRSNHVPAGMLAIALATEAGAAFAVGDYPLCARDGADWMALPEGTDPNHGRSDIEQMLAIAERLALLPRQGVARIKTGSVPAWRDKATLVRTIVAIDGKRQEAVVDTGANLSVITETSARKLGLEIMEGGSVRSSSRASVPVRLAVARHLDIAGTSLTNVVFLVLKDADLQLPLPGGYDIPAIIGFPVLRALGRVTFTPDAMIIGGTQPAGKGADLVASGSNLFVHVRMNGIEVPLHLDSGASSTALGPRFSAEHQAVVAALQRRATRFGGAGGVTEGTAFVLRDAEVEVGSAKARLPAIDVGAPQPNSTENYGTLGQDVLRLLGAYTVDFARMKLTLAGSPRSRTRSPRA